MQVTKKESTKTVANTPQREVEGEQEEEEEQKEKEEGEGEGEGDSNRQKCMSMANAIANGHFATLATRLTQRLSFITCKATPLWLWL